MFSLIKQVFIGLLASIVNASNHIKCMSIKSHQCIIQPALINLHIMNMLKDYVTIHLQLI